MDIIVTTSAFGSDKVIGLGQAYFIPIVAGAGGNGIEIRRELFANQPFPLQEIQNLIKQYQLTAVYSAPETIWKEDGIVNQIGLQNAIQEGISIGSVLIKMPLGNYMPNDSDLQSLHQILRDYRLQDKGIQFTVENDQTACGGRIENLDRFLANCKSNSVPVKMTFDIGNWQWTGTNVFEAAGQMKEYVVYIHCKHVEENYGKHHTVPLPSSRDAAWRELLAILPTDIPRAIEFPLEGNDFTGTAATAAKYIQLLQEETK